MLNIRPLYSLLKARLNLIHSSCQGCGCCMGLSKCQFSLCYLCWLDPFAHLAVLAIHSLPALPGPAGKCLTMWLLGAGDMSPPASALDTIHIARVSFSITYKHPLLGTSLPKGHVGHGVQLLPAQPYSCRKTLRDISFGSRQIKYLSFAEAQNKIAFKGHTGSPRGLSGILKMKEFLVAPKPSFSLCRSIKIYTVAPYQFIKYNLTCLGGSILLVPSIVTLLLPLQTLFLYTSSNAMASAWQGTGCTETFSTALAKLSLFPCKTFQVQISWRNIMLTASNYVTGWFTNLCSFQS